ncbi:hypothetical protein FRC07_007438, partial [Ceratobasidium sp. 392]
MYVQIRQHRSFEVRDEDYLDDDYSMEDDDEHPAPMVARLINFLAPLMPQVTSLSLNLGCHTNSWATNGVLGRAKVLKVNTLPDYGWLDLVPSMHGITHFHSLEVLHVCNTVPSWLWVQLTLGNLVDLRLEADLDGTDLSITQSELVAVLMACRKLQYLDFIDFEIEDPFAGTPVLLNELKSLEIGCKSARILSHALPLIDTGRNTLYLEVSFFYPRNDLHDAVAAMHLFLNRSN